MRKVCVVIFSRANYGRIKCVLSALKKNPGIELQIVVGASALLWRYGNIVDLMISDGFGPNHKIYNVLEGENPITMAKSTGLAIVELATVFENLKPDIVFATGDRYETLATAVAASYMNIPLAHAQGGEVTGSIDESVRHAVSKLAHLHFTATSESTDRLIKMGENPSMIFEVGCPSIDLIKDTDLSLDKVDRLNLGLGHQINWEEKYLLVSQHPVTTEYGEGKVQIEKTLEAVFRTNMQAIWLWPNVDAGSDDISKGLRHFREKHKKSKISFYKNFSVEDYLRVLNGASCAVGNSSSFLREATFLGIPVVNIGTRQNGREKGQNVIDVEGDVEDIYTAISTQIEAKRYQRSSKFGDGISSMKIAAVLSNRNLKINIQKKITY